MYRSIDVGRYSIDTRPIHRLAMCRELIRVEHPLMSANILIMILLVVYRQKHIRRSNTGQLQEVYWSTVGPVSVASQEIVDR